MTSADNAMREPQAAWDTEGVADQMGHEARGHGTNSRPGGMRRCRNDLLDSVPATRPSIGRTVLRDRHLQ